MQWSRVKTILIVILLLVDSFLVCMLGGKAWFAYQRKQEIRENLQSVLSQNGVTLEDSMKIPGKAMMPQLYIDRSRIKEAETAAALLGGTAERKDEGDCSSFQNDCGTVTWNETGELEARLTPEGYVKPEKTQLQSRAQQLLQGAELYTSGALWETDGDTVTVRFKTAGYEVFNRSLTVTYGTKEVRIHGWWTMEPPYAMRSDLYASYDPVEALIVFSRFHLAARVEKMEPGLMLTNSAGNQFALSPVWRIVTDNGVFFVDPLKKTVI